LSKVKLAAGDSREETDGVAVIQFGLDSGDKLNIPSVYKDIDIPPEFSGSGKQFILKRQAEAGYQDFD
jgi:hypothetical protein